jgi:hypothetical protein
MAIGDIGAAHGLVIYAGTQDRRLGYQNDNQRADDIGTLMDAVALKLDASKLKVQQSDPGAVPDGTVWISWVS